jgi:hypothetical protein
MGHLYTICGPPGAGKTTLLKWLNRERPDLKLLKRTTTRKHRKEEGDTKKKSLEYRFVPHSVFAGKLVDLAAINMIEWNGNYYATHWDEIKKALDSEGTYLLLEDIPSAIHLKAAFGPHVTVVLLFIADKDVLTTIEFASPWKGGDFLYDEWKYRLSKKWLSSIVRGDLDPSEINPHAPEWHDYVNKKVRRALPDLAFIVGRIKIGDKIHVLANPRDNQSAMFQGFEEILGQPVVKIFISHSSKDLKAAKILKTKLKKCHIPCFLDSADIKLGEEFSKRITREFPNCSHLVVILSRSALKSPWVPFEVGQAVAHKMKILPFVIEPNLVVPEYLARYNPATDVQEMVCFFSNSAISKTD